jgi:hypothetical protein
MQNDLLRILLLVYKYHEGMQTTVTMGTDVVEWHSNVESSGALWSEWSGQKSIILATTLAKRYAKPKKEYRVRRIKLPGLRIGLKGERWVTDGYFYSVPCSQALRKFNVTAS